MPIDVASGRRRLPRPARLITAAATAVIALLAAGATAADAVTPAPSGVRLADEPTVGRAKFNAAFTHGMVAVEGTNIHYVKGGSGPAILLIHGWPQTWWEWNTVMPGLAQNHTVIAVDLPGLGASTAPTSGYDKKTTARRLHEAVVKLGFSKVTVIGHDVGTLVAYPYARDFPNDVDRVVVVEAPLSGFGLEDVYNISFHFLFNIAPKPIPETILDTADVPTYLGMIFDSAVVPNSIDRERFYLAYSDPAKRSAGYEYYRAYAADAVDNQAHATPKIGVPVIAMGGEFIFGAGVAASFQNVASDVRTVVVPGVGHYPPEEDPAFFVNCVRYFLGDTPGTPTGALAGCAR
ncbi:pimeloyl-ACP methyl ester carboxylesterase [Allocatelliglobosispora scoriae]|uniref:Pimeloyl-ACP methyl ester carboxylesterase n=1 Tax=Allocatelliglobosispora scoriae TaxID=643052 RepID=A0A841BKN5_9ACTN|nr:alpha/beta hydrolase [Allocatelliglobosispora scoriae]MBB5868205.1 pimeloyl-ACP methyl ester carboxylesterase [Allocatelliglobosispora scoriae]